MGMPLLFSILVSYLGRHCWLQEQTFFSPTYYHLLSQHCCCHRQYFHWLSHVLSSEQKRINSFLNSAHRLILVTIVFSIQRCSILSFIQKPHGFCSVINSTKFSCKSIKPFLGCPRSKISVFDALEANLSNLSSCLSFHQNHRSHIQGFPKSNSDHRLSEHHHFPTMKACLPILFRLHHNISKPSVASG